jgi:hypothetical protein
MRQILANKDKAEGSVAGMAREGLRKETRKLERPGLSTGPF